MNIYVYNQNHTDTLELHFPKTRTKLVKEEKQHIFVLKDNACVTKTVIYVVL